MADKTPVADKPTAAAAAKADTPKPTVGRMVHFYKAPIANPNTAKLSQDPWAAIVVRVDDAETVTLHVFGAHPHSDHIVDAAKRSDEKVAGCWMWPPRE